MGSFLDKPVTDKETIKGEGNDLLWGCSAMQGWRVDMEDSHTCISSIPGSPNIGHFCVFDGHGGSLVARKACVELLPVIQDLAVYKDEETEDENYKKQRAAAKSPEAKEATKLSQALYDGLLKLDLIMRKVPVLASGEDHSGSTAITSFVTPTHIILGNTGDSRAVLCRGGKAHFGTIDHKPTDARETTRVQAAGGFIEMGRVNANLAVSRALGDYQYKDRADLPQEAQKITAAADMTVIERAPEDEFLLLCCDGIWDVMSNEEAVDFVTAQLKGGFKVDEICERLIDRCLVKGSKDNMSVLIILMLAAPKPVPGYTPDPISPEADLEADKRNMAETAEQAAISRRLSSILAKDQQKGASTAPN